MISPSLCRTCLGAGLLVSALLHGLALAWFLRLAASPAPPPLESLELDLAMFAPAGTLSDTEPTTAPAPVESPPPPRVEPDRPPEPAPVPVIRPRPPMPPPKSARPPEPKLPVEKPKLKPRPATTAPKAKPKKAAEPSPRPETAEQRQPALLKPPAAARPAQATQPRVQATDRSQSTKPATEASPAGSGGAVSPAARASAERAYLAELQQAIARQQRFPEEARRKRITGTVTLAFAVQANGRIDGVQVVKSSGNPALDRAATETLERLGRFKPIPAPIGRGSWPMRVPIRFDLR